MIDRTSPETETIGCGTPGCDDLNCTYGKDDNWPPVKMALWRVLMDEKLNSGKYIKAFDLIEKLHAAVLTSGLAPCLDLPEPSAWIVEHRNKKKPGDWSAGGGSSIFYGDDVGGYAAHVAHLRGLDFVETVTATPLYAASPDTSTVCTFEKGDSQ